MQQKFPSLRGVYLFAADVSRSVDFYTALGLAVERVGESFARVVWPDGTILEIGGEEQTRSYYPDWEPPGHPGKNTLSFEFPSGEQVDEAYARLVAAGYTGILAPYDPLWQARFAIVQDPDGNPVGLHGRCNVADERQWEGALN